MSQTRTLCELLAIGVVSVLFAGCYVSPVPMAKKKLPIDERVLGYWFDKDEENRYRVTRADGRNYSITLEDFDEDTQTWEKHELPAFLTQVGDERIVNVWIDPEEEGEEPGYVFLKYEVRTDSDPPEIRFWVMAEELFKDEDRNTLHFDSPKKLRKFVEPLLGDAELWSENPAVLTPVKEE